MYIWRPWAISERKVQAMIVLMPAPRFGGIAIQHLNLRKRSKVRKPYELSVKGRKPGLWSSPGTTVPSAQGATHRPYTTSDRWGEAPYTHCAGLCSGNNKPGSTQCTFIRGVQLWVMYSTLGMWYEVTGEIWNEAASVMHVCNMTANSLSGH